MQPRSQAALEQEVERRWTKVQSGEITLEQAFGILEDWIIQLGKRKAFLHPNLKQWMWYDKLHDEWAFAGCGVEEAILLTIGRLGGIKKLPQPEPIADWLVYKDGKELQGPLRLEELRNKLDSQQVQKDILIWSPRATDWLPLNDQQAKEIIFTNLAEEN